MKQRILSALCLAALVVMAGPALAEEVADCTGPGPHDAAVNQCITDAGAGGTCRLEGDCEVANMVVLNLPDLTVTGGNGVGPGASIHRAGGSVFGLLQNSSGTTVENLTITSDAGNGVTNVFTSGGAGPLAQPDDISILDNIIDVQFRCVQQFAVNGPPFNDTNRVTGDPAGIPTGWTIDGNRCNSRNANDLGLFLTGSENTVTDNYVASPSTGILLQNNVKASVPTVQAFGAAPAGSDNLFYGNTVEVLSDPGTVAFYPVGILNFGFDFFTAEPEEPGDRGTGNRFEKNCLTVTDTAGNFGFSAALQTQLADASHWEKNNFTQGISGAGDFGNAGVVNFDTSNSTWAKNDSAGAGDYNMLSLNGTEHDNTFEDIKVGIGHGFEADFVVLDFGIGPNTYKNIKYCNGNIIVVSPGAETGGNKSGIYCSHQLSPARSCPGPEQAAAPLYSGADADGPAVLADAGDEQGTSVDLNEHRLLDNVKPLDYRGVRLLPSDTVTDAGASDDGERERRR